MWIGRKLISAKAKENHGYMKMKTRENYNTGNDTIWGRHHTLGSVLEHSVAKRITLYTSNIPSIPYRILKWYPPSDQRVFDLTETFVQIILNELLVHICMCTLHVYFTDWINQTLRLLPLVNSSAGTAVIIWAVNGREYTSIDRQPAQLVCLMWIQIMDCGWKLQNWLNICYVFTYNEW